MSILGFRLAEWEHFQARVSKDERVWITHVWIDGNRIMGRGPEADDVFLHPDDVPTRVLRRDNGWPRIHPMEARRMFERAKGAIEPEGGVEEEDEAPDEVPPPELLARPAALEEIPRGAKTVGNNAHSAGFSQRAMLSRGPKLTSKVKVAQISDCLKIDGKHPDGRRFVAIWATHTATKGRKAGTTEWKFDFAYVLDLPERLLRRCNATELSEYLAESHSEKE